jgi:hypothetical protein
MLRHLRIAFSVTCGIACVLLIVLWARSYSARETLYGWLPTPGYLQFTSQHGGIMVVVTTEHHPSRWRITSKAAAPLNRRWSFHSHNNGFTRGVEIIAPYWFAVLLAVTLAGAPTMPWKWRFSLRTLLITTTLVAVGLAIMVASR